MFIFILSNIFREKFLHIIDYGAWVSKTNKSGVSKQAGALHKSGVSKQAGALHILPPTRTSAFSFRNLCQSVHFLRHIPVIVYPDISIAVDFAITLPSN